ncbi:MAG: MATE family efflux transporter [Bacteroidetes bacterium]|nr:MATE family efflux transporter [Bacteroidota bacterium]MBS1540672.1 MATE family efflux transporter [Bacteroidota bacterium]
MELRLQTGYRDILKLAMPISFAILVPQFNFITNTIFLGGLGEQALASAGITGVYYLIFAVIGNGLNNGLQMLIARKAGENNPREIGNLFFHGVWLSLAISVLGIVITYTFAPIILRATIHQAATAEMSISFLYIRIWGLPLLYLYIMRNALLVGTNLTKLLIWGTLAETIFNIFFDYALIYGHFGFAAIGFNGAAYASIIAEAAGLIVVFAVIHFKGVNKTFALFENWKINATTTRHVLFKSSPLILQYCISIITWEYFYILIEHHGARALAVSNTMRNIFGVFGVFSWAFAATTNTMVSNIIGQRREEEVLPLIKRIVKLSMLCCVALTVLLNIRPDIFLSIYGQGQLFIEEGTAVIRVISIALILMSFSSIWLNAVTGTGHTKVNLAIEVITLVFYIIYAYLVLEIWDWPITWGWGSELVYWAGMFIMSYGYIQSGKWRTHNN